MKRNWILTLLCVCLFAVAALGETEFLPVLETDGVTLAGEITGNFVSLMPYDDVRLDELNGLLDHMSLNFSAKETADEKMTSIALLVNGDEAVGYTETVTEDGSSLALSCMKDTVYTTSGSETASSQLLGEMSVYDFCGLELADETILEDAVTLLYGLIDAYEGSMTIRSESNQISGFTTASKRKTLSIASADKEEFWQNLLSICPEGKLTDVLSSVKPGGKQTITLYTKDDGTVVKMTWTGRVSAEGGTARDMSFTWRMIHRDDLIKDAVSLKTPCPEGKGTDYNTLTLERKITIEGDKAVCDATWSYNTKISKKVSELSGEAKLTKVEGDGEMRLTGSVSSARKLPTDEESHKLQLTVDLVIAPETPEIAGTVKADTYTGKKLQTAMDLVITLAADWTGDWVTDEGQLTTVQLETMDTGSLISLKEKISRRMNKALLARLVLLPKEDTLFLSRELTDKQWMDIQDAAISVMDAEYAAE